MTAGCWIGMAVLLVVAVVGLVLGYRWVERQRKAGAAARAKAADALIAESGRRALDAERHKTSKEALETWERNFGSRRPR